MVLVILGAVVVLLLLALPLAKRHERRKGRQPGSVGDMRAAIRAGKEHKLETQLRRPERRRRR